MKRNFEEPIIEVIVITDVVSNKTSDIPGDYD